MKPNLFIIGAAKSGTTSLHYYLGTHPDIFMSEPKEPGFFVPEMSYFPDDEPGYLRLFDQAGDCRYRGESSTHYTKLPLYPGAPERIEAFVEEAPRLIYLMRDPVDRAISHYWHNVRKYEEHRGILEALRERVEYRAFSDYRMQLEPYFRTFGRHRVLTLTFEALVRRPQETVGTVLDWLGLDPAIPLTAFDRHNARPDSFRRVRALGLLVRFARSDFWAGISSMAPQWAKDVGTRLSFKEVDATSQPQEAAIRYLQPIMLEQSRDLERYLGMTFSEWTLTFPGRGIPLEPTADSSSPGSFS